MKPTNRQSPSLLISILLAASVLMLLATVLFWCALSAEFDEAGLDEMLTHTSFSTTFATIVRICCIIARGIVGILGTFKGAEIFESLCDRFSTIYKTGNSPITFERTTTWSLIAMVLISIVFGIIGYLGGVGYYVSVILGIICAFAPIAYLALNAILFSILKNKERHQEYG